MAIKERRIKCAACGQRETVMQGERGPVSAYCDVCRKVEAVRRLAGARFLR
jgi:predicted nucleic acid-binding Zn ribbon protein